jgi:hypothetical protein
MYFAFHDSSITDEKQAAQPTKAVQRRRQLAIFTLPSSLFVRDTTVVY